MERKLLLNLFRTDGHDDSMPCIVAASTSRANIGLSAKDVDELAFALVTPLGAQDDSHYIVRI